MLALIQRSKHGKVVVDNEITGAIKQGIVTLIGIEKTDSTDTADKILYKLLNYRIFSDVEDKMNLSLLDIQGGLLLVPQFTLAADTKKGLRPSFSSAASPAASQELFDYLVTQAKQTYPHVETGIFGANMQVEICNDGPVTFMLSA